MSTPAGIGHTGLRIAQLVVALLLAARLWISLAMPPIGDEAYYWMWGQKLAWSYFDHPPLHAWLLRGVDQLFGWNVVSLRLLTWLTLGGTLAIIWNWCKRIAPDAPGSWFWPAAALYLASPLFFIMSGIAFHDHLLIFLCLLAGHFFLLFAERFETGQGGMSWLYAGAIALGLAVLTKYNAVLVGLGVAAFMVIRPQLRPSLRTPHPWLAALLAVALQLPVFWWNLTTGLASYKFHLSERWGGDIAFRPAGLAIFVLIALIVVSPALVPSLVGMIRNPLGTPFADRARQLALATFTTSTLAMAGMSLVVVPFFYWNITAFVLAMPLLVFWLRHPVLRALHYLYGLLWAALIIVNSTIAPVSVLMGGSDWTTASTYGWNAVSSEIGRLRQTHPVGFIATTRYTTAAQLGFALHDPEVTALSPRHDQYDYWFDAAAHQGQDALIVTDPQLGTSEIAPYFDTLEKLADVPYTALGKTIYAPSIWLGHGFQATPSP